jgi:hypothetical protein
MATDSLREYGCDEDTVAYFTHMFDYNVPKGKLARGATVVDCVELVSAFYGREATPELELQAHVFGWCVEWLQAFFLVIDDIMDHSVTRRGGALLVQSGEGGLQRGRIFQAPLGTAPCQEDRFRGEAARRYAQHGSLQAVGVAWAVALEQRHRRVPRLQHQANAELPDAVACRACSSQPGAHLHRRSFIKRRRTPQTRRGEAQFNTRTDVLVRPISPTSNGFDWDAKLQSKRLNRFLLFLGLHQV